MPASENELINLLAHIIAFPTKTGDFYANDRCFEYLEEYLAQHKLVINTEVSNNFRSIFATTLPTNKPKVILQAHLDVVPAKTYILEEKASRLYGRGVYDMKFAVACYLQLVKDLGPELGNYDFGLMLTSDEEWGGENGVKALLDRGFSTDVCLLPDGGDNWQIEAGCNGIWIARLQAHGKAAHGSRPWEGKNAISGVLETINKITALYGDIDPTKSTLTVSEIGGGTAMNQVPDFATATLDMRFVSDDDYTSKHAKIQQIIESSDVQLETIAHVSNCVTDMKNPSIISFCEVAANVLGSPIKPTKSFGSSDARYFTARNIPTIVIRPTGGGAHSDEEWIDKAEFLQFYEVLKAFIIETAKIGQ